MVKRQKDTNGKRQKGRLCELYDRGGRGRAGSPRHPPPIVPNQQSVRVGTVFHPHNVPAGRKKTKQQKTQRRSILCIIILAGWSNCIILYICCSSLSFLVLNPTLSCKQSTYTFPSHWTLRPDRATSCPPESGLNASKRLQSVYLILFFFCFLNFHIHHRKKINHP